MTAFLCFKAKTKVNKKEKKERWRLNRRIQI